MPDSTRQSDDVPEDSVTEMKLTRASGEKTVGGFHIRTVQGELDPGALQHHLSPLPAYSTVAADSEGSHPELKNK